jgi:hypothetical protein
MNVHSLPENTATGWSGSEVTRVPVKPWFMVLVMTSAMSPSSRWTTKGTPIGLGGTELPASVIAVGVIVTAVPSWAATTVTYAPCTSPSLMTFQPTT